MPLKQLSHVVPLNLAVAAGATTPDPGGAAAKGAEIWSTTTNSKLIWNGTAWVGVAGVTGTATINFGAAPGSNEASIAVTGQAAITALSTVEAFIMSGDTTTDHTASDHAYASLWIAFTCGTPTAGTGFTLYARSSERMQGSFAVRWAWS